MNGLNIINADSISVIPSVKEQAMEVWQLMNPNERIPPTSAELDLAVKLVNDELNTIAATQQRLLALKRKVVA